MSINEFRESPIIMFIFSVALSLVVSFSAGDAKTIASISPIPSLDNLSGKWEDVSLLASLPALNGGLGSAQALRDVLSIGNLSFPPITMTGGTGSLFIDGRSPRLERSRWYAYQVLRSASDSDLNVETAVRMMYEERALLFHVTIKNLGTSRRGFELGISLAAYTSRHSHWGWKVPRDADSTSFSAAALNEGSSLMLRDPARGLVNCFSFEHKPDKLVAYGHSGMATWHVTLEPGASREVDYVLVFGDGNANVRKSAANAALHFRKVYGEVKTDWGRRFAGMFKMDNPFSSGNLPVLATSDRDLNRMYYMSALSLLCVLRTGFPVAPRVYISDTPESNCTMMYFWDTREFATALALLDPVMMKRYLKAWLQKGIYNGYAEEYLTGTLQGPWYSANDYSVFILLNDYLDVTGDTAFLNEKINGATVLQHMDSIATHWESLVRPGQTLADYGGAANLLEAVPTYINEVPSFNAANVWMMRRVAAIYAEKGGEARAEELRAKAARLLKAVLDMYVPGQGVWDCIHRDGKRVEVRSVFDFATIGLTIPNDLTMKMRSEMLRFVETELLTDHWMRALSLSDPAAAESDRPDHGPMGAYCAWPAETMAVMCEFGEFHDALDFLHRCAATTYEGPFSQSRELMGKTKDARVRINERGTGGIPSQTYNASNGGSFAETIIREFFGYKPDFLHHSLVPDTRPRGFDGRLLNVRQDGRYYDITSTAQGLRINPAQ